MKMIAIPFLLFIPATIILHGCQVSPGANASSKDSTGFRNGGYASAEKWGEHLVIISGCGDCHTPKTMTAKGPMPDVTRALAGSPSPALLPSVMPGQVEKGMAATIDQTAWIGPWGKSFAANITSDSTGIGNWTEEQFITCIRKGVTKGLPGARPMMPPMPWQNIAQMRDDELKAMFTYLKSTKPVHNIVPQYEPPVAAK